LIDPAELPYVPAVTVDIDAPLDVFLAQLADAHEADAIAFRSPAWRERVAENDRIEAEIAAERRKVR
jgi:hypothetical protein